VNVINGYFGSIIVGFQFEGPLYVDSFLFCLTESH